MRYQAELIMLFSFAEADCSCQCKTGGNSLSRLVHIGMQDWDHAHPVSWWIETQPRAVHDLELCEYIFLKGFKI